MLKSVSTLLMSVGLLLTIPSFTQSFWGMTSRGGATDHGAIFKTNSSGGGYQLKFSFPEATGDNPFGDLLEASNGRFYGLTSDGGATGNGVLFEFNPVNGIYTVRASFNGTALGSEPRGSLVEGPGGKLYGMTMNGGANTDGVLFEYDTITRVLTKKIDLNSAITGRNPEGNLLLASDGNLYGLNPQGGTNGMGTLFRYVIATNTLTVMVHFSGTDGSVPEGSLIEPVSGMLYGCTLYGGTAGFGVLFSYDLSLNIATAQCSFNGTGTGRNPSGSPLYASNGKFYGMTQIGGANNMGVLWEWNPVTTTLTNLLNFNGTNGSFPRASVIQANNGLLYGMTGMSSSGSAFSFDIISGTLTQIFTMGSQENGVDPHGSFIQSANGKLYAMTRYGGPSGYGSIFSYDLVSATPQLEWSFVAHFYGAMPERSLVPAGNGKLLGIATVGGIYNFGTLFTFDTITNVVTVLIQFDGTVMGKYPKGPPVLASDGIFYGVNEQGGLNNNGVIYAYDPSSGVITKKLDFPPAVAISFGSRPTLTMTEGINGMLYGFTLSGGTANNGTLFEYNYITNTVQKKVDFTGLNGENPMSILARGSDGKLYGTTNTGGINDDGTIFAYDPLTDSLETLGDFNQTQTGRYPMQEQLLEYAPGIFYGVCSQGGSGNIGTIFRYDVVADTITRQYTFVQTGSNGWYPHGSVIPAPGGALYGMNWTGGTNGEGTIYRFTPPTSVVATTALNTPTGGMPFNELMLASEVPLISCVSAGGVFCENTNFVGFVSATGGVFTYQWLLNGVPINGATSAYLQVTNLTTADAGNYTCIVYSSTDSVISSSINVQILPSPAVLISSSDTVICPGDSVMLSATGAQSYTWNPAITPNTYFVPASTTTYSVTGTGSNGCSTTASLTISVSCVGITTNDESNFHPRVYPNPSDGLFTITVAGVNDFEVRVSNVTGQQISAPVIYSADNARLDLSNASPGIYFLEISTSALRAQQKIIVE